MRITLLSRVPLLAAALMLGALVTPALADQSPNGALHSDKHVCSDPAPGFAACHAHIRTKGGSATPDATSSFTSGYTPAQLRTAYGLATDASATVAVVDAYAHRAAQADLDAYRAQFGLTTSARIKEVNQTGGSITTVAFDAGWAQEEMLDLEMVSAICPSCSILYVGANSASFNDLAAAVDTAAAMGATVISNSYGGTEFSSEAGIAQHYVHSGVAITVSSGDSGYGVQIPAAFNTVTAVGGTNLTLNTGTNTRRTETVWSGAGSGCSAYIGKPTWQKDAGCSRRTVADVSAVADPNTGVAVYTTAGSTGGNNWYVFGGTSVAAPIIAGVYALSGNTAGTPASLAYAAPAGTLFDVTAGSNGSCVTRKNRSGAAYLCTGVAGYDGPTGVGTPKGTAGF